MASATPVAVGLGDASTGRIGQCQKRISEAWVDCPRLWEIRGVWSLSSSSSSLSGCSSSRRGICPLPFSSSSPSSSWPGSVKTRDGLSFEIPVGSDRGATAISTISNGKSRTGRRGGGGGDGGRSWRACRSLRDCEYHQRCSVGALGVGNIFRSRMGLQLNGSDLKANVDMTRGVPRGSANGEAGAADESQTIDHISDALSELATREERGAEEERGGKAEVEKDDDDDDEEEEELGKSGLEDERFLREVAIAVDADSALRMIAERMGEEDGREVTIEDCSRLILASLAEGNYTLAFSVLNAMRNRRTQQRIEQQQGGDMTDDRSVSTRRWRWPLPEVPVYAALVRGLAASLRVSDAVEAVGDVRRRGVPAGDEVPFGKVLNCPVCQTPIAVVQPQHGVQLVPCARCRYEYELMSGDVVSCESESISGNAGFLARLLRTVRLVNKPLPAAVHSMVVSAPDGLARTHSFATVSAEVPAQEGQRVTVVSAAPDESRRSLLGPLTTSARTPGWRSGEPMAITNHETGRILNVQRAPPKSGSGASTDLSLLIPAALLLAGSDAATGFIDPSLPRLVAIGAVTTLAAGGLANTFLLPRLNQLPQRTADAAAIRQKLLRQHEVLDLRLEELSAAASNEVRMLARMWQLQNKMEAVGDPSTYSARIDRVRNARKGLDMRLTSRLELIDNYAKILSMVEIEIEMSVDVLAAEAAGAAATIAEQIERLMEVESLQKDWQMQAEANDELERLLRQAPPLLEST